MGIYTYSVKQMAEAERSEHAATVTKLKSIISQLQKQMKAERSEHAATVTRLHEQESMFLQLQMEAERTVTRLQAQLSSAVAEASKLQMAMEDKKTKVSLGTIY